MLKIEEDLVVIGGQLNFTSNLCSSALLKFTCLGGKCNWHYLPENLKNSRRNMVATTIPNKLLHCN